MNDVTFDIFAPKNGQNFGQVLEKLTNIIMNKIIYKKNQENATNSDRKRENIKNNVTHLRGNSKKFSLFNLFNNKVKNSLFTFIFTFIFKNLEKFNKNFLQVYSVYIGAVY